MNTMQENHQLKIDIHREELKKMEVYLRELKSHPLNHVYNEDNKNNRTQIEYLLRNRAIEYDKNENLTINYVCMQQCYFGDVLWVCVGNFMILEHYKHFYVIENLTSVWSHDERENKIIKASYVWEQVQS